MTTAFTTRDWRALPPGFPAQLIDGGLVKDAPPSVMHQQILGRLFRLLLQAGDPDAVLVGPIGVVLGTHDAFHPDLVVLDREPAPAASEVDPPGLVIEVLSQSTEARDRNAKLPRYLEAGVREVWLVDGRTRTIEIHDREGMRAYRGDAPLASDVLPDLDARASDAFG